MTPEMQNNGFLDPNAFIPGQALKQPYPGNPTGSGYAPFSSGHTAGTRGTPIGQDNDARANPNSTFLQDSNPFLANPNARPVGDPARREQRIMEARSQPQGFDPAMFDQLMQNPIFQQLIQLFMQR